MLLGPGHLPRKIQITIEDATHVRVTCCRRIGRYTKAEGSATALSRFGRALQIWWPLLGEGTWGVDHRTNALNIIHINILKFVTHESTAKSCVFPLPSSFWRFGQGFGIGLAAWLSAIEDMGRGTLNFVCIGLGAFVLILRSHAQLFLQLGDYLWGHFEDRLSFWILYERRAPFRLPRMYFFLLLLAHIAVHWLLWGWKQGANHGPLLGLLAHILLVLLWVEGGYVWHKSLRISFCCSLLQIAHFSIASTHLSQLCLCKIKVVAGNFRFEFCRFIIHMHRSCMALNRKIGEHGLSGLNRHLLGLICLVCLSSFDPPLEARGTTSWP